MRVLVTGGTGFTGSHLVRRCLERGHAVRVLDNQKGVFHDELVGAGAEILLGSVHDRDAVRRAVDGMEVVHHVAASFRDAIASRETYRGERRGDAHRRGGIGPGGGAPGRLLQHGRRSRKRAKPSGRRERADLSRRLLPADQVGRLAIREVAGKGLDVSILRPTGIYGPGDPARFLMMFRMVKRGHFFIIGDGMATYHPVYIDNLCDAFELAAEHPAAAGETFIVADDRYYRWNEIIPMVGQALRRKVRIHRLPLGPVRLVSALVEGACRPFRIPPPLFRRRAEMFSHVRAFDISKARRLLGYEPKVPFEEGLRRTAAWYRNRGWL